MMPYSNFNDEPIKSTKPAEPPKTGREQRQERRKSNRKPKK